MSTVLRVSTHIYGVSEEIDGKTFIFQSKPRHVTPQIDCLGKMSPVLRVSTHIYGFVTSFFYIAILALLKVKFCVFGFNTNNVCSG